MLCLSCMHEQSRRGAHASPPRFFNCLMHGRKCGARAYSPFDASCIASYTILRRRMALPPPLDVVWSGPVMSGLWSGPVMSGPVWSQKMLITHIWQNFIHRIPLDSL